MPGTNKEGQSKDRKKGLTDRDADKHQCLQYMTQR